MKDSLTWVDAFGLSCKKGDKKTQEPAFIKENRVPQDKETVLNGKKYEKVKGNRMKGAQVYKSDNKHYHRDTLHRGKSSHIEVYNKKGKHIGEMDPITGKIDTSKKDPTKSLKL